MRTVIALIFSLGLGVSAAQNTTSNIRPSTNSGCDILQEIAKTHVPVVDLGILTNNQIGNIFANVEGRGVRNVSNSQIENIAANLTLSPTTVRALLSNCRNDAPALLASRASLETIYGVRVPNRTVSWLLGNTSDTFQSPFFIARPDETHSFASILAANKLFKLQTNANSLILKFLSNNHLNQLERDAFINTIPAITFRSANR